MPFAIATRDYPSPISQHESLSLTRIEFSSHTTAAGADEGQLNGIGLRHCAGRWLCAGSAAEEQRTHQAEPRHRAVWTGGPAAATDQLKRCAERDSKLTCIDETVDPVVSRQLMSASTDAGRGPAGSYANRTYCLTTFNPSCNATAMSTNRGATYNQLPPRRRAADRRTVHCGGRGSRGLHVHRPERRGLKRRHIRAGRNGVPHSHCLPGQTRATTPCVHDLVQAEASRIVMATSNSSHMVRSTGGPDCASSSDGVQTVIVATCLHYGCGAHW
jgi:hypothetical protein